MGSARPGALLLIASFVLLLFTVSFPTSFVHAASVTVRPLSWEDLSGRVINQHYAIDNNLATFMNISNGTDNATYFNFSSIYADEHVLGVNLSFVYTTTGFSDDEWALFWSRDATKGWSVLRAASSDNLVSETVSYELSAGTRPWSWNDLTVNLSSRIVVNTTGSTDPFTFELAETWLTVAVDLEGPVITLLDPPIGNISSQSSVTFSFQATDEHAAIENCSLLIDGAYNETNTSVVEGSTTSYTTSFGDGSYLWAVTCYDNSSGFIQATSEERTLYVDLDAPNVSLFSPMNNTPFSAGLPVQLIFNFTDTSTYATCSLLVNGSVNQTQVSWPGVSQYFLVLLANGFYSWRVNCTDPFGHSGISPTWLVNVSNNVAPVLDAVNVSRNVSLELGTTTSVWCNATAHDADAADIVSAQARLHWPGYWGADEESLQYTNTSCSFEVLNTTAQRVSCLFGVSALARAGAWLCEINATDVGGETGGATETFFVEPFYAFNITPPYITYAGALSPGYTYPNELVQVRNNGNAPIDISLDGYGVVDGDGLAMDCTLGNISLDLHRYSLSPTTFELMTPLTDSAVLLDDFDLEPGNESSNSQRAVYWRVRLPVPVNGTCSGFVTFTAIPN